MAKEKKIKSSGKDFDRKQWRNPKGQYSSPKKFNKNLKPERTISDENK